MGICCATIILVHSDNCKGQYKLAKHFHHIQCSIILVHGDNCKSQYKLAKHFRHLQRLANEKEKKVLRVWLNARHGKREVDHVTGVAKISIKRVVSND